MSCPYCLNISAQLFNNYCIFFLLSMNVLNTRVVNSQQDACFLLAILKMDIYALRATPTLIALRWQNKTKNDKTWQKMTKMTKICNIFVFTVGFYFGDKRYQPIWLKDRLKWLDSEGRPFEAIGISVDTQKRLQTCRCGTIITLLTQTTMRLQLTLMHA